MDTASVLMHDAGAFDVPCGSCTLCCQNDAVRIFPHEDATQWQTQPHPYKPGALMLAHQANGDCVYLDRARGCTIQDSKPQMCREMDCRRLAAAMSWTVARKLEAQGRLRIAIWRRGRDLAKEA
jgi:hypothetical protein